MTGSLILKPKSDENSWKIEILNNLPSLTVDKINKLQKGDGTGLRSIQYYIINHKKKFNLCMKVILLDLVESLNLSMTGEQMKQIPELMNTEDYHSLTIDDVALCCYRIKTAYYEPPTSKMRISDFFAYLRQYTAEKLGFIYDENDQKKNELTINGGDRLCDRNSIDINASKVAMNRFKAEILIKQDTPKPKAKKEKQDTDKKGGKDGKSTK